MGNFEAADMAQLLTGLEGDHGHGARSGQRRQDGHTDGWCSDVEECKSDQEETSDTPETGESQYLIRATLVVAVTAIVMVVLGVAFSYFGARWGALQHIMLSIRDRLGLSKGQEFIKPWSGHQAAGQLSIAILNVTRVLASEGDPSSGYKYWYSYQSEPVDPAPVAMLCDAIGGGANAFHLDFQGGPLELGLKTAKITQAPLCELSARSSGSISFSFNHKERSRDMHGSSAMGQVSCSPMQDGRPGCEFTANALLDKIMGTPPDSQPPQSEPCPALPGFPAESPAFLEDWPMPAEGSVNFSVWPKKGFNGAVVRHEGVLVLAFRAGDLFIVDLDDTYVPKGAPTVIYHKQLPANLRLHALEDPRLFVHRGQLYLQAFGLWGRGGPVDGRQYLVRLERLSGTANGTGSAGFRFGPPREVLLPEIIPPNLPMSKLNMSRPVREKNWVAFMYEDSIHMIYYLNPPIVLRLSEHDLGAAPDAEIRTEFVAAGGNTSVRFLYGSMRGGTPAVYDAALGAYITFFHSKFTHYVETPKGPAKVGYYYMACCVFSAKPPFSIQLMSGEPLIGRHFFNNSVANIHESHGIFPEGVMYEPEHDSYVVSYGKNDNAMGAVRFDRRKLIDNLQAPLPKTWEGPPC